MKHLLIILCSLFALNGFSQLIITDSNWSSKYIYVDGQSGKYGNPFLCDSIGHVQSSYSTITSMYCPNKLEDHKGFSILIKPSCNTITTTCLRCSKFYSYQEPEIRDTIDHKKISESGSGLWGIKMLAPFLIINQLDTIPAIDSVTYEKINGDFYKREYTSEYAIFYTMPEDSTSLDADSIVFELELDSLYREFDVADRRISRLQDRIDLEREHKRELRNQILDARIRQRELLRIRRRYYRQL